MSGEGNGNPLQCSCLENPRDGGACWAAVYGVAQSWTQLKRLSSSSSSSSSKRDVCSYYGLKSLPPIVLGQWVQTQQIRKNHLSLFLEIIKPHLISWEMKDNIYRHSFQDIFRIPTDANFGSLFHCEKLWWKSDFTSHVSSFFFF